MCIHVYVYASAWVCPCMWKPEDILRCHLWGYPMRQGLSLAQSSPIRLLWIGQWAVTIFSAGSTGSCYGTRHFYMGFRVKLGSLCSKDTHFANLTSWPLELSFVLISKNGPVKRSPYLALTVKLTEAIFM